MKRYILIIIMAFGIVNGQNLRKIVDMRGQWKFNIGDSKEYAKLDYNDDDWDKIVVPSSWEDEGYPGLNGICWYRYTIDEYYELPQENMLLILGYIDDVDEVYFNGCLIGRKGSFHPNYDSAYDILRVYEVPAGLIRQNQTNQVAVRIYDDVGDGGIYRGRKIGLFQSNEKYSFVHIDLSGKWKFKSGNNRKWRLPNCDDSFWQTINVPGNWEEQGYCNYNGYGWYRKSFEMKKSKPQHLILAAGKIDDYDAVYVNGKKIGSSMPGGPEIYEQNNHWEHVRYYYIPKSCINWGGKNTIAVCVYDGYLDGGIRKGPVEIISRDEFRLREENDDYSFTEVLEMIFGD